MEYLRFLVGKIRSYSLTTLIRLEAESFFLGLFSLAPTTAGVILRATFAKLFFKNIKGFPWIQPRCIIVHSDRIRVGTNFGMNSGTYINGVGEIEIGNYVLIGSNVTISSGMHPIEDESPPIFSRVCVPKKITIEDDVWIGAGAVIMPGVTLKKGSVIGANTVVTKNTEPYCIYVGAPAKKIRSRITSDIDIKNV